MKKFLRKLFKKKKNEDGIDKLNRFLDSLISYYKAEKEIYTNVEKSLAYAVKNAGNKIHQLKHVIKRSDKTIKKASQKINKKNYNTAVDYFNKGIKAYDSYPFRAYYWFLMAEPLLKQSSCSELNTIAVKKDCFGKLRDMYQKEIIIGEMFYGWDEAPNVRECIDKKKEAEEEISKLENITIN